nr:DUF4870 domain-containing protein [Dehalococcoidia bacterium]
MTSKKIRELHELLTDGIITPDDFDEAKDALLNDLSQDNSESTISIRELHALLTDEIVTKDDFDKAKQYLLKSEDSNPSFNQNLFLTWLHLSGLLAFLFPCLGCMVPVVLWQTHRHYPEVDKHGRMITDWIINLIGLSLVSVLFTLIMAGDPEDIIFVFSLITAPVQATVAIVGAIKAWQGELFQYPLIWKFFSRVPGEEQPLFRFVKTVRGAKSRFKK